MIIRTMFYWSPFIKPLDNLSFSQNFTAYIYAIPLIIFSRRLNETIELGLKWD